MAEEGAEVVVEEWTEPVDLTAFGDDGPCTYFVGGYSALRSASDALQQLTYRDDRVVILPGTYTGDLTLDSTVLNPIDIRGEGTVTFEGKLVIGYSSFDESKVLKVPRYGENDEQAAPQPADGEEAAPPAEEEAEDGDENKKAEPARPPLLTVTNMSFLSGLIAEGLSKAYIDDCNFCTPTGVPAVEHAAKIHALSTVQLQRCHFYGNAKSVVYCYPRAKASFFDCTFAGSAKPSASTETVRRKRGYVPPPPPPPSAPESVECEVGLYLDDADVSVVRSVVSHVAIGVLARDSCKGTSIQDSVVSLTSANGVLLLDNASPKLSRVSVSLNGRESLVVGNNSHPIIRKCNFVGDVRLKVNAVHTGLTDNIIGLNKQLIVDGSHFTIKGFTVVPTDPTIVKPKKVVPADEE